RCRAAKIQSPDRSPVNTRPVRFAPCAAGARPTSSSCARGSPNPGAGRPQYGSSANARRRRWATSSRQATSRGHARQTLERASRASRLRAELASRATWSACVARLVRGAAGSPGQPVPGGTGEGYRSPVRGWGSRSVTTASRGLGHVGHLGAGVLDQGVTVEGGSHPVRATADGDRVAAEAFVGDHGPGVAGAERGDRAALVAGDLLGSG